MKLSFLILFSISLIVFFCFFYLSPPTGNFHSVKIQYPNLIELNEDQLNELNEIAQRTVDLCKDEYLQKQSIRPFGFLYEKNNFELVVYEDSVTTLTDEIYSKTKQSLYTIFKEKKQRLCCMVYVGTIKNQDYPNGSDTLCFEFRSTEFAKVFTIVRAIKKSGNTLLFGKTYNQYS